MSAEAIGWGLGRAWARLNWLGKLLVGVAASALITMCVYSPEEKQASFAAATPPAKAKTPERIEAERQAAASEALAKAKEELAFRKTVLAARALKGSLRDPDSLVWESIRANHDATVICMEYRARNVSV